MDAIFSGCVSLTSINFTNLNTREVTSMNSMFYNCISLTSLDSTHFDTQFCMTETE